MTDPAPTPEPAPEQPKCCKCVEYQDEAEWRLQVIEDYVDAVTAWNLLRVINHPKDPGIHPEKSILYQRLVALVTGKKL